MHANRLAHTCKKVHTYRETGAYTQTDGIGRQIESCQYCNDFFFISVPGYDAVINSSVNVSHDGYFTVSVVTLRNVDDAVDVGQVAML
jgi:hypothetical protein